jgi:hypothetical protein
LNISLTEPLLKKVNKEPNPLAYHFCRSELRLVTFNKNDGYDTNPFTFIMEYEVSEEALGTSILLLNTGEVFYNSILLN